MIGTLKTEAGEAIKLGNITFDLGDFTGHIRQAVRELESQRVVRRIWEGDHTVWKPSPVEITNRLEWLRLPDSMLKEIPGIESFAAEIKREDFASVVLLGMGGSSLAPGMFSGIFGSGIRFSVIDTTAPETVGAASELANREKTLFIVSTKSGSTLETISLLDHFYAGLSAKVPSAGAHFIAITDPGSPLAVTADKLQFRRVFLNNPDTGGRFSALSFFGLVPGGLCGIDIRQLLGSAKNAMEACGPETPVPENPGAVLGAALGSLAQLGLDKLTFFISPRIAPFGDWLEQLIAESTGKEGRGILPVIGETPGGRYGSDRVFVFLELEGEEFPEYIRSEVSGRGLPGITIKVPGPYGIGGQIYTWELATAVAGSILEINPFDQPNVESTKKAARAVLAQMKKGAFPAGAQSSPEGVSVYGSPGEASPAALKKFLGRITEGKYIGIQAFLAPSGKTRSLIGLIAESLRQKTGAAVTCGFGPRYLHSTGQLHKGDSGKGCFIQFVSGPGKDIPVPGTGLGFGALTLAAALGDRKALADAGREVLTFYLSEVDKGLDYIFYSLKNQT